MGSDWRNSLGKFIVGGCGTQLGLLFGCGGLASLVLICAVCAVSGTLGVQMASLGQEVALLYADAPTGLPPESGPQVSEPGPTPAAAQPPGGAPPADTAPVPVAAAPPAEAPTSLIPLVTAHDGAVNLRSGPGTGFDKIGLIPNGKSLEIVGRNGDSSWWLVSGPDGLAWVADSVVIASNVGDDVPVIGVPPPMAQPAPQPAVVATATATQILPSPTPTRPVGTATAVAEATRLFVEDTVGFKELRKHLGAAPISESFSPKGDQIAILEGIKLQTVAGDGSSGQIWLEADEILRPVDSAIWSPDGTHIAFTVDYKSRKCKPCRSVGLLRLKDGKIFYLKTPDDMDSEAPRWTQDGHLLVLVHPREPANGVVYLYDTSGYGQVASGFYILSASHEGQKWSPWLPGRVWRAGFSERPDSYYND